jgi:AbrB family looped-hinge helix DNA binding protein
MSLTKVGPKHQITIPKKVFEALRLEVGDLVEVVHHQGKALIIPKSTVTKAPSAKLSPEEQKLVASANAKIEAIRTDIANAVGLTEEEAEVAAKVGLIDPEQRYWWLEDWQRGEREAQRDIGQGETSRPFERVSDLTDHLRRLR